MTPEQILLTHGHIDHAGGAMALKEALRARPGAGEVPIVGPDERDRFLLEGLEEQGRAYGLDGARNVTPDRWLAEGEEVEVGGHAFSVLHCPGHTPGHVVFVNAAAKFAVVGDVLFRGSVGRTDFPYGDTDALLRSIREKLFPLGDAWRSCAATDQGRPSGPNGWATRSWARAPADAGSALAAAAVGLAFDGGAK